MTEQRKSPNRLGGKDRRALEDLILEHQSQIENGQWTINKFAQHAQEKIGRPIVSSNVASAAKTVEVKFRLSSPRVSPNSLNQFNHELKLIRTHLIPLLQELAKDVSPELLALYSNDIDDVD